MAFDRPTVEALTSASGDSATEVVTGSVESVVFRNEENGYTVCTIKPPGASAKPFTLVGACAAIWQGEEISANGVWIMHPQHGRQFQAAAITCVTPTSVEGIRRYLASGMIRGVGKELARRIVAQFGAQTLNIIEKESARLEEVAGIGRGRRQQIKASWSEQHSIRDIMIFLQSHGIGTAQAARIYKHYGPDAIAIVKNNPYRLCNDIWGVGFKTADAIAISVGVPHASPQRARAGLLHILRTQADEEGHCFCSEPELLLSAQDMLGISAEIIAEALAGEVSAGTVVRETGRVYMRALYEAECAVARHLHDLLGHQVRYRPIEAQRALEWAEGKMGVVLAPGQRKALLSALTTKVSIITGGPGVGKTTIIRALTEIFAARHLDMALAAPTGRAAKRMSESTGRSALTIHRLLRYNPHEHVFDHDADNPIDADVFIIDEVSMVDVRLMSQFLQALPPWATLILVGDIDQLPSVGPGNVLRDIIRSGVAPCARLDFNFRQQSSGMIVRNAHLVNHGELFENSTGDSDFYFIDTDEPEKIVARVVELVTSRIPHRFGFAPLEDVQILTPMRRNLLGTESLNATLQAALNPSGDALTRGGTTFRVRDRVMQIRNNYDKEVFNGDIGFVKAVDSDAREIVVVFDGCPVRYEYADLDELVHAYACTIHKSQGSEYPAVVLVIHTQHFKLLQRNLLYTGITRGRKLVCIVGSKRAVRMAVRNNQVIERRTGLWERLAAGTATPGAPA